LANAYLFNFCPQMSARQVISAISHTYSWLARLGKICSSSLGYFTIKVNNIYNLALNRFVQIGTYLLKLHSHKFQLICRISTYLLNLNCPVPNIFPPNSPRSNLLNSRMRIVKS
jgi:hypothetical protein